EIADAAGIVRLAFPHSGQLRISLVTRRRADRRRAGDRQTRGHHQRCADCGPQTNSIWTHAPFPPNAALNLRRVYSKARRRGPLDRATRVSIVQRSRKERDESPKTAPALVC